MDDLRGIQMAEIDGLMYELRETREAFNRLHKDYIKLLQQQGEIERENEAMKSVLKEMIRVSEYSGALSPLRIKCMVHDFIGD